MGIWDWYNKPGSRSGRPTRGLVIALILLSFFVGVFFMVLYTVLAPFLFARVPG